jgi:5-methylcytosine-specific restriction endonuclease McrA
MATKYDAEYQAKYRAAHKEHATRTRREYYYAHREEAIKSAATWRRENAERALENERRSRILRRDANPEGWRDEWRQRMSKWRKENKDAWLKNARVWNHNRTARTNGNGGSFSVDELNTLFDEQEGLCAYCGRLLFESFATPFHIEHKTPISRGGTNNIGNIALSCAECNLKKGTMTDDEFELIKT